MTRESDRDRRPRDPSSQESRPRGRKGTAAAPPDSYRHISVLVGRARAFEAEGGGLLRILPGDIAASFRLRRNPDPAGGEFADTASCLLRLADEAGQVWETEASFYLDVFVEHMANLRWATWLVYWDEVPKEWKRAFAGDLMIAGATCMLDDRGYRKFFVGDEAVELKFKYQCPSFDVVLHKSGDDDYRTPLLVRVSGLVDLEMSEIRPLVFEMDWKLLLFRNELYFDAAEGGWVDDGWPLPLVFRRTGTTGPPQALVRYEAGSANPAEAR